ncbi:MAG: aldehyde dehydrogenase family protein, partial [Pseudomonadota bacterium]
MGDLLTRDEYAAIAAGIDWPRGAFIDGKFRPGKGAKLETINPATGETIAVIAGCGAKDVDLAVAKAREAFEQGVWSKLHPSERKGVMIRLAKLMTRNRRELAVMESVEAGKPIADCEGIDVPEAIDCIKWHAEAIDKIYDQTAPAGDDAIAMIVREPVG